VYETPRLATAWVSDDGVVRDPRECAAAKPNQAPVDPQSRLHRELIRLLLRHSLFCDQRHLVLLAQRVAVLLLRQRACFGRWIPVLPLGHGLAATCHLPAASGVASAGSAMHRTRSSRSTDRLSFGQPEQTRRFCSMFDRHRVDRRNLNHLATDRYGIGSLLMGTAAAAMLWPVPTRLTATGLLA